MTRCYICPRSADHGHHFVPRSRGGELSVPLCAFCHKKITENRATQCYLLKRKLLAAGWDLDEVKYLLKKVEHA
jgi:5-methylcytosine-specific restriction endonuclease McrA